MSVRWVKERKLCSGQWLRQIIFFSSICIYTFCPYINFPQECAIERANKKISFSHFQIFMELLKKKRKNFYLNKYWSKKKGSEKIICSHPHTTVIHIHIFFSALWINTIESKEIANEKKGKEICVKKDIIKQTHLLTPKQIDVKEWYVNCEWRKNRDIIV